MRRTYFEKSWQLGLAIGFSEGPAVLAYLDGLNQLLVNSVLASPAWSRKLREIKPARRRLRNAGRTF